TVGRASPRPGRESERMSAQLLQQHLNDRAWRVLENARSYCERLISDVTRVVDGYLDEVSFDRASVCFVVVGSVGRFEALEASDLDLTPVLRTAEALEKFKDHDQP